jgi:hypothetical protein
MGKRYQIIENSSKKQNSFPSIQLFSLRNLSYFLIILRLCDLAALRFNVFFNAKPRGRKDAMDSIKRHKYTQNL